MADTDNKADSGPQAMLRGLLIVVAVAVIAVVGVLLFTKKTPGGSPLGGSSQGTQQVAMLDSEAIYALPEFTKAKKDLEELGNHKETELLQIIKDKKLSPEEAEKLRVQMRDDLQQEQGKRVTPLNRRVTLAIASLAKERGYKVVLDKRIVVTGVADVTEDVKKKFEEMKSADLSKETEPADPADSTVGYVNQETSPSCVSTRKPSRRCSSSIRRWPVRFRRRPRTCRPMTARRSVRRWPRRSRRSRSRS